MSRVYFDFIPVEINFIIIEQIDINRSYVPLLEIVKSLLKFSENFRVAFNKYNGLINTGFINHFNKTNYQDYKKFSFMHEIWIPLFDIYEYTVDSAGIVMGDKQLGSSLAFRAALMIVESYNLEFSYVAKNMLIYAVDENINQLRTNTDLSKTETIIFEIRDKITRYFTYKRHFFHKNPLNKIHKEYPDWKSLLNSIKGKKIKEKMFSVNGYKIR